MKKTILMVAVAVGVLASFGGPSSGQEDNMAISDFDVRPSILAGQWYEADPEKLREMVETFMKYTRLRDDLGKVYAIIAPHAGYVYSGNIAAAAYKQVQGKSYDTVVVIAPNHRDPRLQFSSVYTKGGYETPLGVAPIDSETARAIVMHDPSDNIRESTLGHIDSEEHSVEIQIPFIQVSVGEFKLVPIVMGKQDLESCERLAEALAAALEEKNALIVASSDLSHFLTDKQAETLDAVVAARVSEFEPDGLIRDLNQQKCQACGGGPMAAAMLAAKKLGAVKSTVLEEGNSGDVTGDNDSVVGYMAAAMSNPEEQASQKVGVDLGLTDDEKTVLKNVVRETLKTVVNGGAVPRFNNFNGRLGSNWGAFVTLNKGGRLRGCIGQIVGQKPLITTVAEMTMAAALDDPRFKRVAPEELDDITFEISVLTPVKKIDDIEEIVIGRDGLIITRGHNRGLLLPQVATEYGWDRVTFLEQTCRKAGLPLDAWKDDDITMEMFSAEVFE